MNPSFGILLWIVIGAVAGWAASMIMKTRQGVGMDIVVGVVGALIGGFLTRVLFGDSARDNGIFASFGVALLGSVVLLAIVRAATGRRPLPH